MVQSDIDLLKPKAVVLQGVDVLQCFLKAGAFKQHCHFALDGILVSRLQLEDCKPRQIITIAAQSSLQA